MSRMTPIPTQVSSVIEQLAPNNRATLLAIRELIFEVADADPRIGPLEEALRWGEPAYLTTATKTGSTIRLGIEKTSGMPAIFFNCKTSLVEEFRQQFGKTLKYSKNRAVLIDEDEEHEPELKICIASALTYHLR